ncbi:unnamed protein product [Didymodactylos carnosus]|uniref:Uncharacterized protein n=1 Tax=Didymodactylos carnosus TaxID=1234261 RepID=A0A8S2RT94_9BILA|nr:unnamed protein product [Didymodactylos carnosus]CAF4182395.1 unnamed protein product [Didymodactylos carnosus]
MDGTFKSCPSPFARVYSIHALSPILKGTIPALYTLLPDKTETWIDNSEAMFEKRCTSALKCISKIKHPVYLAFSARVFNSFIPSAMSTGDPFDCNEWKKIKSPIDPSVIAGQKTEI